MAAKKQPAKQPIRTYRWQPPGSPDELGAAEQIAHGILTGRRDLLPSVERIMVAGLGPDGTLRAITLFRDALTTPGNLHRDPRVAIADAAAAAGLAPVTPPTDGPRSLP